MKIGGLHLILAGIIAIIRADFDLEYDEAADAKYDSKAIQFDPEIFMTPVGEENNVKL